MLTAQVSPRKVLLANLHKGFLGRKKELILSSPEDFKGKKAVVVLPAAVTKIYQETVTAKEQLPELISRHLVELKIEERQALYFATKLDTPADVARFLLLFIDKARLTKFLHEAGQKKLKIEGFLPEPVVLHKLLVDEIAGDEKRLILHIGEEDSSIYFLDRYGPVKVLSQVVATSKLIPEIQKFLQVSEIERVCCLGVYFGEESLAFDEKVFAEQTGIELISGNKALSARLQKAGITLVDGEALNKFVAVAAAAVLFNKKEIIKLDEIDLDSERPKARLAKPQVQPLVLKEKKLLPNIRLILLTLGVAFIVVGLILGGLWLRSRGLLPGQGEAPTTVPTQIQLSPTPTLTPAPTVNPKDIKVRVLNGSGIAGSASTIADALKEESFDVIKIGNADSFDFVETEIRYKEGEQEKVNLVIESLKEREIATPEASLELDDEVDVEIIIGRD